MTMIRGWCPDAWHPMAAGDGLLVRVRPRLGRLARDQLLGLCDAAIAHGNGLIDLTSRANLQLRGVTEDGFPRLLDRLLALDLVDPDPVAEARRATLIAPDWHAGDDSHRIASALAERIGELPDLPAKTGFVVDAGFAPILAHASGDFRIERADHGGLLLRADGRPTGVAIHPEDAVDGLIALARWFVASGGTGRMARHDAPLPGWATGDLLPVAARSTIWPGPHSLGSAYGLPFGRVEAHVLMTAVQSADAVRLTPWRILLIEGAAAVPPDGLIHDPADPLLRVDACPGQPHCPQASVETRDLARHLAPHIDGPLHVSGCAKGCARSRPAAVTLTGRDGRFDLALDARAGAPADRTSLTPADLFAHFGAA